MSVQGVPTAYIRFLKKVYVGQVGAVQTDCLSSSFEIKRGTRQGDPISPVLFNAALEQLMRELSAKWSASSECGI